MTALLQRQRGCDLLVRRPLLLQQRHLGQGGTREVGLRSRGARKLDGDVAADGRVAAARRLMAEERRHPDAVDRAALEPQLLREPVLQELADGEQPV